MSWLPHHINTYLRVLSTRQQGQGKWEIEEPTPKQPYWEIQYSGKAQEPHLKFNIEIGPRLLHIHTKLEGMTLYCDHCLALFRYLLRLNDELSVVKWGMTQEGFVTFSLDWPTNDASFDEFETILRLFLSQYYLYYKDVELVAHDEKLAKHIEQRVKCMKTIPLEGFSS